MIGGKKRLQTGTEAAVWLEEVQVLDRTLAREHAFDSQQWLQVS